MFIFDKNRKFSSEKNKCAKHFNLKVMKKALITIIFGLIPVCAFTQQNQIWIFPIQPGTKEWTNLKTEDERLSSLQIPSDTLSKMRTSTLISACLNYPLSASYAGFINIQAGYLSLETKFNGLNELSKRRYSTELLIYIYKKAGAKGFDDPELNLDVKFWPLKLKLIELILAQGKFLFLIGIENKNNLLILAQEKFSIKKLSNDFTIDDLRSTTFLMARVLHSLNYIDFEYEYNRSGALKSFTDNSELSDLRIIDRVLELTKKYSIENITDALIFR